jgi:hypothetical protein
MLPAFNSTSCSPCCSSSSSSFSSTSSIPFLLFSPEPSLHLLYPSLSLLFRGFSVIGFFFFLTSVYGYFLVFSSNPISSFSLLLPGGKNHRLIPWYFSESLVHSFSLPVAFFPLFFFPYSSSLSLSLDQRCD